MIITSLVETVAYRVHQPRWAFDPISGAGAAAEGGRANRKGLHALYLALDPQTALAEYQQRSSLLRPGTLVSYRISVQKIVDFSAGFTKDWPHQWREFFCDWSALCWPQVQAACCFAPTGVSRD